jgi:hypothetical protein
MGAKPPARSKPDAKRAVAKAASNAEFFTPEYLDRRRRIMARRSGFKGIDDLNPKAPAGHADGIRTSTWLTQSVKHTHRKHAMNISPQDVIDVFVAAGVKNWVLMGLHGYVDYLPEPRGTQEVDVMVPFGQRKRAAKAIREAWPGLVEVELSQAVRFMDSNRDRKEDDAGDFRRMVRANYDRIDRDDLRRLAYRIWHGAGEEIDRFVEIAMGDEPFPV